MISIKNKQDCCGCGSCAAICPKNCISMKEDNEGFLYPLVNESNCINCNQCVKACPIINANEEIINKKQKAVIASSKNKSILMESTSGGFFSHIALFVLKHGGVVYGAAFDKSFRVVHICVEKIEELYRLRNSKYVQSDLSGAFRDIKSKLKKGLIVCFSGTPCQIEALLCFLGNKPDNLILVDVVCRAVPSPGIWKKYLNYMSKEHGEISSIRFRDKKYGYQYSTMLIQFSNGNEIRNSIESDIWLRMFFSGMIIRPSCANCKFRKRYRNSDFTIWDCFAVSDYTKKINENKGATAVLIHSMKGIFLLERIKKELTLYSVSADRIVNRMKELSISPSMNPKRSRFYSELYENNNIGKIIDDFFPITIGIRIKRTFRWLLYVLGLDTTVKRIKRKLKG